MYYFHLTACDWIVGAGAGMSTALMIVHAMPCPAAPTRLTRSVILGHTISSVTHTQQLWCGVGGEA
jgi:hypothetical protein